MFTPKTPLRYPHGCNQTSCLREEQVITSVIMEACSQQMKKDGKQLKGYNGTGIEINTFQKDRSALSKREVIWVSVLDQGWMRLF